MKKLQIPKIDRQDRVKCVLLAILGIAVAFVSLMCFSSGISGAMIVAVILLAASGAIGYFATKRVIFSALSIASGPVLIILGIALFVLAESISGVLLVLSVGLGCLSGFLALIILGGLLALAGRKIYVAIHRKRYGFDPADDLEDFEEDERADDEKKKDRRIKLIVYTSFICSLLIINFLLFILKAEEIFVPSYPPYYFGGALIGLVINVVMICIFAVVAIALKMIFNKKIKVSILILCALILPTAQSQIHDKLFEYGGIFHSAIEEGGIFYPIYELRNTTSRAEDKHEQKDIWKHCHFVHSEVIAYGRGPLFESSIYHLDATAQPSHYMIAVDAGIGSKVEYFEVYLTPRSDVKPEQVRIWVDKSSFERVELSSEVLSDGRIKLTLITVADPDFTNIKTAVGLNYEIVKEN
jgi:hypothetical protein